MNETQLIAQKLDFLPKIYRKMIYQQLIASSVVGLLAGIIFDVHAGLSVLAGALPVIIGIAVSTPFANLKQSKSSPSAIVTSALKAEAIKIIIIFMLLWLVFKYYVYLIPLGLVVGLVMSALISGRAISYIDQINIKTKRNKKKIGSRII